MPDQSRISTAKADYHRALDALRAKGLDQAARPDITPSSGPWRDMHDTWRALCAAYVGIEGTGFASDLMQKPRAASKRRRKGPTAEEIRRQSGFKFVIRGGAQAAGAEKPVAVPDLGEPMKRTA